MLLRASTDASAGRAGYAYGAGVLSPHLRKPRLRGRLHQVAFFVSIPAGITLVALAQGAKARMGAAIFAASLTGLYGVSATYHRGLWSLGAERLMKHLDHSMIFVLIAGSYTPITLLALRPAWGITLLALVATPQLLRSLSRAELALLVAGGLLYTVGAVVLACNRPDPHPAVFGYHEVWHTFVLGAGACHFVLVFLLVRA